MAELTDRISLPPTAWSKNINKNGVTGKKSRSRKRHGTQRLQWCWQRWRLRRRSTLTNGGTRKKRRLQVGLLLGTLNPGKFGRLLN